MYSVPDLVEKLRQNGWRIYYQAGNHSYGLTSPYGPDLRLLVGMDGVTLIDDAEGDEYVFDDEGHVFKLTRVKKRIMVAECNTLYDAIVRVAAILRRRR
jgi:phage gp45-like